MIECGTTYVRCNKPKRKHVRMQKLTCLFKPYMCQTSMRGLEAKVRQEVTQAGPHYSRKLSCRIQPLSTSLTEAGCIRPSGM